MKKFLITAVVVVVVVAIVILTGPFYILNEGEQSVITRFGAIVNTEVDAGFKFKIPFVDNVVKYPKKVLSWDGDAQRIPTRENQFIWVDATARWRITDPALFYESVTTVTQGYARLDDVVDSAVRTVISDNLLNEAVRNTNRINELSYSEQTTQTLDNLVDAEQLRNLTATTTRYEDISIGRQSLSNSMLLRASELTMEYGIELIDILIRQIRYSDDLTESVYDRMIKERNQIAEAYRSYGEGQKAEWFGKLDNDKKTILSEAYATSEEIRGTADAKATATYADSYSKDPDFFELWRTLESYRKVIPKLDLVLSTDMEYFDYLFSKQGGTDTP